MQDYYDLFIELSLQQCTKGDYSDKNKVKMHNIATIKLKQLKDKIKSDHNLEILSKLLLFDDERVKINAVSLCFEMNIFVDQSIIVLEQLIENSLDSTICFAARIMLKNYQENQSGDGSKPLKK